MTTQTYAHKIRTEGSFPQTQPQPQQLRCICQHPPEDNDSCPCPSHTPTTANPEPIAQCTATEHLAQRSPAEQSNEYAGGQWEQPPLPGMFPEERTQCSAEHSPSHEVVGPVRIKGMVLVCRLSGHRTIFQRQPTGFGPWVWVAGFTTNQGEPYLSRYPNGDPVQEVRVAPTLAQLLQLMADLAPAAQHKPLSAKAKRSREARKQAADGHPKGTTPKRKPETGL